jgi:hypothetical protein
MIAYSSQWLEALQVRRQAARWHRKNLIGTAQYEAILAAYPVGFYTPNVFVRIGLAIFCWVLVSSAFGIFNLFILDSGSEKAFGVGLLVFGAGLLVALELIISNKRHYRSGIDDALLYITLSCFIVGLWLLIVPGLDEEFLSACALALPLLTFGAVRYTDKLVTVLAFLCLSAVVFLTVLEIGSAGRMVLPFVLMAYAAAGYLGVHHLKGRPALQLWDGCLNVLEGLCLITFYVSGNYFVIQVLSDAWFDQPDVPMAFVFYAFTAVVPVLYILFGLRQRDRLLLRAGMALLVLSVLTFRYYFSLGHPEVLVTVAGAVLVVFAYVVIRLLKRGDLPFTYTQDAEEPEEGQELESFVVNETFAKSVQGPASIGENPFGGGQFGGGGSGGNY